ncbi:MAG: hypothetical protein ABIN58_01005 [candidate division WOR-3 bacterium]
MRRTRKAFLDLAGLPEKEWDVVFMTGSGALALEAVIATAKRSITPLFVDRQEAEFARRLADLTFIYNKHGLNTEDVAYVHYETSISELNASGFKAKGVTLVDCVSSFPYYLPPADADIVVTVSGKQLEAPPGIAIIAIHRRVYETGFFDPEDMTASYLNLNRYVSYASSKNETPNTPAITVLQDLCSRLERFDRSALIQRVDSRYSALKECFGAGPSTAPPVYTFPRKLDCQETLGLYGKNRTQLFLWHSGPQASMDFDNLLRTLWRLDHENPDATFRWT